MLAWHSGVISNSAAVAHRPNARSEPLASAIAKKRQEDVHIDGCESAVGDGAADGTSESESRVQIKTSWGSRVDLGCEGSLGRVDLGRAGAGGRGSGGHFAAMCDGSDKGLSGEWWRRG
jgi:hypothetical protein